MIDLAHAIERNTTEHYALVAARMPSFEMHVEVDAHWYSSGLPTGFFNGVSWCDLPADAARADERIDELLGWFEARDLPCRFWLGPSSRPSTLGERLLARGLDRLLDAPGMTANLSGVSDEMPAGCRIERVRDDAALRAFLAVVSGAYGQAPDPNDPWFTVYSQVGYDLDGPIRHYLGFKDGEPAGAATGVFSAGIVGIYHVHVLPSARGNGLGSAMTRAPMLDALALGVRTAGLHATPMGESVYRRLGFVERCRFGVYEKRRRGS